MAVLTTLRQALAAGPVTLTLADLDGLMGVTMFPDRTIAFAPDLDDGELHTTLVHELLHLARGPVAAELVDEEEEAVERETARRLLPNAAVLAGMVHNWTRPQMRMLAHAHQLDTAAVATALNPPTRPLLAVKPRQVTQDTVTLAARYAPEER